MGNKTDLAASREVRREEAQEYADANGMFYIETSAKTAENVNELFETVRAPMSMLCHCGFCSKSFTFSDTQLQIAKKLPRGIGMTTPTKA